MVSRLGGPELIVIDGLVFGLFVISVMSLAVTVELPRLLSVRLKFFVPAASAELEGRVALVSEEVIETVCVVFVIKFQLASTALTVTAKATLACSETGATVLLVAVPGAVVSRATKSWILVSAA